MIGLKFVGKCETGSVPDGDYYGLAYAADGADKGWRVICVHVKNGTQWTGSTSSRGSEMFDFKKVITDAEDEGIEVLYVAWNKALPHLISHYHKCWPNFEPDPTEIEVLQKLPKLLLAHIGVSI